MENPTTLDFDYDDYHTPEEPEHVTTEETHGTLEDGMDVMESAANHGHEDALPDVEGSADGIFWGVMAAFCFLAGLSLGLVLYFKSSFALTVAGWLRRCCPKIISQGSAQDPVLLTVVDRGTKESADNEGADKEEEQKSDSSSDDDKRCKCGVDCEKCKNEDGECACDDRGKEAEGERKPSLSQGEEVDGGGEAAAAENDKENEHANDGEEANEACEDDTCNDGKKRNSSSSSSSSSDNEGNEEGEERSVRQRKKGVVEAAVKALEGEAHQSPSEEKVDGEHKE